MTDCFRLPPVTPMPSIINMPVCEHAKPKSTWCDKCNNNTLEERINTLEESYMGLRVENKFLMEEVEKLKQQNEFLNLKINTICIDKTPFDLLKQVPTWT